LLLISINFNLKTSRSWFRKKLYTKCFPVEVYSIILLVFYSYPYSSLAAKRTNRWGGLFYLQAVAQNGAASPSIWTGIWNLEGIFVRENAEIAVIWKICCVSSLYCKGF